MSEIHKYTVAIEQRELDDLKTRLGLTRWPEAETVNDWSQGIPLAYLREVVDYWHNEYDWRRAEALLNSWPNFVTNINGLDIHFLHIPSPHAQAKPLIMTHGWPGSVFEFMKVIGPLTDPVAHGGDAADAFHLVCPSLPGFGFSGKPTSAGWGVEKIADTWNELMARLGYPNYFAQGGDWGAAVVHAIGERCTKTCLAMHTNMPILSPGEAVLNDLTDFEKDAAAGTQHYYDWESGYSKEQSTRPQSVGYGLVDSPVGLAGWILEKYWAWTDCDGHPENVLTRDELLDNLMLYWLPGAGASSARLYWESFSVLANEKAPIHIPVGVSMFPHEIFRSSRRWCEERYQDLRYYKQLDKGGHFAAFEQPGTFVDELRSYFRLVR